MRSSAQGLFMLMTNGIGATIGTLGAGAVANHLVFSRPAGIEQVEGWHTAWLIFAAYALIVAVMFWIVFRDDTPSPKLSEEQAESAPAAPEGMISPE